MSLNKLVFKESLMKSPILDFAQKAVEENDELAEKLYLKAAEQDYSVAQFNLGLLYGIKETCFSKFVLKTT